MFWLCLLQVALAEEPTIILEVELGPIERAWMLEMRTDKSVVQVPCADDGVSPDRVMNDHRATCTGTAPGHEMTLLLRDGRQERTAKVSWPADVDVLQARWRPDGVTVASWPLLPAVSSEEPSPGPGAGRAVEDMLDATDAEQLPVRVSEKEGNASFWISGLGLLAVLGVCWRIVSLGEDIPHVAMPETTGPGLEHREEAGLGEAIEEAARRGAVLVVAGEEVSLPSNAHPGPVLRATSSDVIDLLDALSALQRRDPLMPPTLVVQAGFLSHQDGLGVAPLEALERGLPPGVRAVVLGA
ncbi:MAG: hypothetical protein VX519_06470 [Myxococcota bacterium]|nr:hypothetical protein [Myxococcota bacterium]